MNRLCTTACIIISVCGMAFTAGAEKLLTMKIGMTWPREWDLLSTGIPTGDAQILYGQMIDGKIGYGIAGNFLWHTRSKEVKDSIKGHHKTINEQKSFMFPIMGFFMLDPVPDLIVHPAAHFQIGYNSLIYSYNEDSLGSKKPLHPYFYGLIIKTGIDAVYDIGDRSALSIGFEYRWADTKTTATTSGWFDKRNMGGIGLNAGFRVFL